MGTAKKMVEPKILHNGSIETGTSVESNGVVIEEETTYTDIKSPIPKISEGTPIMIEVGDEYPTYLGQFLIRKTHIKITFQYFGDIKEIDTPLRLAQEKQSSYLQEYLQRPIISSKVNKENLDTIGLLDEEKNAKDNQKQIEKESVDTDGMYPFEQWFKQNEASLPSATVDKKFIPQNKLSDNITSPEKLPDNISEDEFSALFAD
jgi:hypothetical protein